MSTLIQDYKNLHEIPEEGFKEFKTHKYIKDVLEKLNCILFELNPTGLIAFFNFNYQSSIAFRCELDGLPITETTNLDYKSNHKGYMHACGHDGHMAILLEFARRIENIKCKKNICLIFQPSEEKYGGANFIIQSPEYKSLNIKEVYGLHLWPGIKKANIASRSSIMMAASNEIDIKMVGKSTHIANYIEGIDAIKISSLYLNEIRERDVLFNCGKISSEGARNIICKEVNLECSARTLNNSKRKEFLKYLNDLSVKYTNLYNVNIYINSNRFTPSLTNSTRLFNKYRCFIDDVIEPVYQSEDFSFYSENSETLFFFLGIGNTPLLHESNFSFDLNVLEKGVNLFEMIASTN